MSAQTLKGTSRTNWARLDEKSDEEIDTSEVAPLGPEFFAHARLRKPRNRVTLTVDVDAEVAQWFEEQGGEFQQRINAALRIYAEAHKEAGR